MLAGSYYSNTISTSSQTDDTDIIDSIETTIGRTGIVVKKLTLISASDISIKINHASVYSTLYKDTDNLYKLSLDGDDIKITSFIIKEKNTDVFVAVIY